MPQGFVPAEVFLERDGIKIYLVYIDDLIESGAYIYRYSLNPDSSDPFDVRRLSTMKVTEQPKKPGDYIPSEWDNEHQYNKAVVDYDNEVEKWWQGEKESGINALVEAIDSGELTKDGIQHIFCLGGPDHGKEIPIPDNGIHGDYRVLWSSDKSMKVAIHVEDFDRVISSIVKSSSPSSNGSTSSRFVGLWSNHDIFLMSQANDKSAAKEIATAKARQQGKDPSCVQVIDITKN